MRAVLVRMSAAFLAVVLLVAVGWWAGRATLKPVEVGEGGESPVYAKVAQGRVGRAIEVSATVRQPVRVVSVNHLAGVVTGVGEDVVGPGDVLYEVVGRPVRAVPGSYPFYRDLVLGSRGPDVRQLQEYLIAAGYLSGTPDGVLGARTRAGIRNWQRANGQQQATGTLELGEVVAVPQLPTVLSLGEGIRPGLSVTGGEDAVLAPTGERTFVLVLDDSQSRRVPADAAIAVMFEDQEWDAVITDMSVDDSGFTVFELGGPDNTDVCRDACDLLPSGEELSLRSRVVIEPEIEGLTVPAAAVRTRANGSTYVVMTNGAEREVRVLGSGSGLVIVEGLTEGDDVQVLAGAEEAVAQPKASTTVESATTPAGPR
ncbi:peptidoglycan-binding protein [Georgenia yuyongxinii]